MNALDGEGITDVLRVPGLIVEGMGRSVDNERIGRVSRTICRFGILTRDLAPQGAPVRDV